MQNRKGGGGGKQGEASNGERDCTNKARDPRLVSPSASQPPSDASTTGSSPAPPTLPASVNTSSADFVPLREYETLQHILATREDQLQRLATQLNSANITIDSFLAELNSTVDTAEKDKLKAASLRRSLAGETRLRKEQELLVSKLRNSESYLLHLRLNCTPLHPTFEAISVMAGQTTVGGGARGRESADDILDHSTHSQGEVSFALPPLSFLAALRSEVEALRRWTELQPVSSSRQMKDKTTPSASPYAPLAASLSRRPPPSPARTKPRLPSSSPTSPCERHQEASRSSPSLCYSSVLRDSHPSSPTSVPSPSYSSPRSEPSEAHRECPRTSSNSHAYPQQPRGEQKGEADDDENGDHHAREDDDDDVGGGDDFAGFKPATEILEN